MCLCVGLLCCSSYVTCLALVVWNMLILYVHRHLLSEMYKIWIYHSSCVCACLSGECYCQLHISAVLNLLYLSEQRWVQSVQGVAKIINSEHFCMTYFDLVQADILCPLQHSFMIYCSYILHIQWAQWESISPRCSSYSKLPAGFTAHLKSLRGLLNFIYSTPHL